MPVHPTAVPNPGSARRSRAAVWTGLVVCVAVGLGRPVAAQSVSLMSSATTYATAGGTMTFSVTISYPPGASTVGFTIDQVPAGWTYSGALGANPPDIVPDAGTAGRFEFAYLSPPSGSATFSFTASYPGGLSGVQRFGSVAAIVRPLALRVGTTDIVLSAAGSPPPPLGASPLKLVNVSARSQTGTSANTLIAGFVITGSQPQPVLIRAIGPTLANYGVTGALPAAHLDVFAGSSATPLASADDWAAAADPGAIAAAASQVGAFALPEGSHDAALLTTLDPGAYTAVVNGQAGASGVALVEVYDADSGSTADRRIVDLSARAATGAGDATLTAGFVVRGGGATKRVLVRAVGPALSSFQVANALGRPRLTVLDPAGVVIATNSGWSAAPDAAAIAAAAAQSGAFALPAGSADAAVLLDLAPGAYTAQVGSTDGAGGVALVEVYEVP